MVAFYDHEPSWWCSIRLRNCWLIKLVVGPTHARDGTLVLLMTNAHDLVRIAVAAPIRNSGHSLLSVGGDVGGTGCSKLVC